MLTTQVLGAHDVSDAFISEMFALYSVYYDRTDKGRFADDLRCKDAIILLKHDGRIVGFTTLESRPFDHLGRTGVVVFSGDTVVDRAYWGQMDLAYAWLRAVATLSRRFAGLPVYWLLIVKGHRTYRFMPSFGKGFVPHWEASANDPDLLQLRDALATARFGDAFDPETGIVSFDGKLDRLSARWAEPSAREAARADVAFFLEANPGYRQGDELVCLCPLTPENMRPLTRRVFEAALSQ